MKFYVGVQTQKQLDASEKFILSFARIRARKKKKYIINNKDWIMDSGAFSEIKLHGKYTFTLDYYLNYIKEYNPNFFVNCDYMCEPSQLERTGLTIKEHQEKTIENQIYLYDKKNEMGIKSILMGTLQGWKIFDYLDHIDMMKERGILLDYMGVGSICRRFKTKEIVKILKWINYEIPDIKLHGFGVKIKVLEYPEVFKYMYSCDSMAWTYTGRGFAEFGKHGILFGKKCLIDSSFICNKKADDCASCIRFMCYWVDRINKVIELNEKQTNLFDYIISKKD